MTQKLIEQGRATWAYETVERRKQELGGRTERTAKEYRQLLRGIPAMVQFNGLGQTLAFLASKAKPGNERQPANKHQRALDDIIAGLKRSESVGEKFRPAAGYGAIQVLMSSDAAFYRLATVEALAALQWLKRFAEAAIEEPAEGEVEGDQ